MKKHSLSAIAAAGLFAGSFAVSANAADLGGNCCADLEERVAELEATTVRKGNRKVSLTISGWVAEQVTWWDDGVEDNTYVTGLGTTLGSNVKFTGQATIVPGWTAGYVLHIEIDGSDSLTTNQVNPDGPGLFTLNNGTSAGVTSPGNKNYVQALQSYWFVKSDHWGKVGVGLQSSPSDNAAILVDGSGTLVPANWVAFDVLSFGIRNSLGGFVGADGANVGLADAVTWGAAGACIPGDCYGVPTNNVRYDSPTFAGFSFSSSWGEDDVWDVAFRWAGEHYGFKGAAVVTYGESFDDRLFGFPPANNEYWQAGLYLQHVASGIFGLVNYGNIDTDARDRDADVWYFKAGIRAKCTPLGATIPYAEYMTSEDGISPDAEFEWWGVGVVQEIDAAAMSMWIKYRQFSLESETVCVNGCQDLDELTFGALINF